MSRRKFVPPITLTPDERMFAALQEGYSTRFNISPVCRGITDANRPWANAKKILDSILLQDRPHPTETIALMMCAAIIRAHTGIINGEEDANGEMLLWER